MDLFFKILLLAGWGIAIAQSHAGTQVYFSPNGGCETQAAQLISKAKSTLDIAVYSLNNPAIVSAISAAAKRGVKIRVLTDRTQAFGKGNLDATRTLATLGQNFRVHSKNRIMHNKFGIADGKLMMTGSFNWTRSAEQANDENCMITDDSNIVVSFKKRFETHLWVVNTLEKSQKYLGTRGIGMIHRKTAGK